VLLLLLFCFVLGVLPQHYFPMEKITRDSAHMRPVRTVRVGTESKMTAAERRFLNYVERHDIPVVYLQPSPKKGNSGSARRYQRYMMASTIKEAKQLGSSAADVSWDFSRGFITVPSLEPDVERHVFDAVALCIEHDQQHVIDAHGIECLRSPENSDYLLASCLLF
jgi:hypothetical protein